MSQKFRLPNKTMWNLQLITSRCRDSQRKWRKLVAMADRNQDPAMMLLLAELRDDIAFIQDVAKDALNGEYNQEA